MSIWKKISLYTIYIGIGAILVSPILVDNRLVFPFITTKVFLFRVVVEIIFLAFLALNIVSEEYRPKWSWPLVLLTAFVAVAALSSSQAWCAHERPGSSCWIFPWVQVCFWDFSGWDKC